LLNAEPADARKVGKNAQEDLHVANDEDEGLKQKIWSAANVQKRSEGHKAWKYSRGFRTTESPRVRTGHGILPGWQLYKSTKTSTQLRRQLDEAHKHDASRKAKIQKKKAECTT
jgi:hypothetical protein